MSHANNEASHCQSASYKAVSSRQYQMSSADSSHPTPRAMSLSAGHPTPAAAATDTSDGSTTINTTTTTTTNNNNNTHTASRPFRARDPVTVPRLTESGVQMAARIPNILPHERVFPIQIGSELFKLSGASLSSDAPSYFSQYFQCQIKQAEAGGEDTNTSIRTLYIDRDPSTFRDISLHLQGYHVHPRDGTHFVRLFADAQFYSLPRLISQLHEESIFMSIGHREFQIPRDLFQDPGNTPNYFSLGFAVFFSSPDDLFPGLDREALIRPPSILPPQVPGRSADTFAELLHLLRGYPVKIRSEEHRQTLLRDCRYFNFKGLEQKLIRHALAYNQARQRHEITLRIEDVLKSGISVLAEPTPSDSLAGWVNYARPYVDDKAAELVLEIGGENTKLIFFSQQQQSQPQTPAPQSAATSPFSGTGHSTGSQTGIRAEFFRDTKTRVARMFEVIATKLSLPPTTQPLGLLMAKGGASSQPPTPGNTPLSEDLVRVVLEPETAITLDGEPFPLPSTATNADGSIDLGMSSAAGSGSGSVSGSGSGERLRKRRRADYAALESDPASWIVKTGQWRLRIQAVKNGKSGVECVLVGVKLDAFRSELARNQQRGFL